MIFVVEHEKDGVWQLQTLLDVDEINTEEFEPIKKIFLCETIDEAAVVIGELRKERFE
jgi:hypothetical protein